MIDKQYNTLLSTLINEGTMVPNKRTGINCLTGNTTILTYDSAPFYQGRAINYMGAIAELIGFLQGADSAKRFRELGTKTWDVNANKTPAWLNNPYRKGEDDMGRVYGVQGRRWTNQEGVFFDQLEKVVNNLSQGIDDRGEIITYWNTGELHKGCLRPCLHSFQFNLLGDTLNLTAIQRSCDVPLGLVYNVMQCWVFLNLMIRLTGDKYKVGSVTHVINNPHVYENQIEAMKELLSREIPVSEVEPKAHILSNIQTLRCLQKVNHVSELVYFEDYDPLPPLKNKIPFAM